MAKTGQRREAFGVYYFVVEIEGERFAHFRSATGLKSEGEVRSSRLALCAATKLVLGTGLDLLGIDAPERM